MIAWTLRLLLLLIVIRLVWRFLAGVIDGLTGEAPRSRSRKSVPLVRDPVCGTYVVRARALTMEADGEIHYFCSERCRDEYAGLRQPPGSRLDAPDAGERRSQRS